jgi:hypothetical protein
MIDGFIAQRLRSMLAFRFFCGVYKAFIGDWVHKEIKELLMGL